MGVLAQGLGYGTAGQAAGSSLGWGEAGAGLTAAGDVVSGIGQSQQYGYAAQVAANNAAIMHANAGAAITAGSYEESAAKLRTGLLVGEEKATQSANGVDVNVGSPVAVRNTTQTIGAMDAAMIHYNAARQAWGLTNEANAETAQSKLDKMAGTNAIFGSLYKAGGDLLSSASSIGSKYAQFKYLSDTSGGSATATSGGGGASYSDNVPY